MADCSVLLQQGLKLVQTATQLDLSGNYSEALRHYSLALEAFISVLKMEKNPRIKQTLAGKVSAYMNRAEELKALTEGTGATQSTHSISDLQLPSTPLEAPSLTKTATSPIAFPAPPSLPPFPMSPPSVENVRPGQPLMGDAEYTPRSSPIVVRLTNGQVGVDYSSLFTPYLTGCSKVTVFENNIMHPHQIMNIVRFCEMCVRSGGIRAIELHTVVQNELHNRFIADSFAELQKSLEPFNIELVIVGDSITEQARPNRIILSNGWKFESDRGLDFYFAPQGTFVIGSLDMSLRPVQETTITISKEFIEILQ